MLQKIINGSIYSPDPLPKNYGILIENDVIIEVGDSGIFPTGIHTIDAKGGLITPGLIDIHVHGGNTFDTMDEGRQALNEMARFFASTGVTSFLPTTVAASSIDTDNAIERVVSFAQSDGEARILGIHLEGPYLDFTYKGAQPEQHLRPATPEEFLPWLNSGVVKIITVAPEIEGSLELISKGVEMGVKFAVGHSNASYEVMKEAIDRGLSQATHLFNGMPPLHHRNPAVVGAVLTDDRVYAQIITDGIHLHPAIVDLIFRAKGTDRTVLITDAIRAAGAQDGTHQLGDQMVVVKDGIARTSSGSLAGSTLKLNVALRNTIGFTGRSLEEILRSATTVPAESIDMEDKIGAIKQGYKADIAIFDEDFVPQMTMVSGKVAYEV